MRQIRIVATLAVGLAIAACRPSSLHMVSVPAAGVTSNTDSIRTAWAGIARGPSRTYMRIGKDCGGCLVPVAISAVSGNENFDPSNPPTAPNAVAYVVNSGAVPTEMYGFVPGADEYFVANRDANTGAAVWEIVSIPRTARGVITIRKGNKVEGCHHPKATKPAAAFRTCDGEHASGTAVKGVPAFFQLAADGMDWLVAHAPALAGEDPAWIACSDGCCTFNAT